MKIANIRASVHRIPAYMPLFDLPIERAARVVCEVETDDGLLGVGYTSRFLPSAVVAILANEILPAVKGLDPRKHELIHERLKPVLSARGVQTGVNLLALSCLDLALWDIKGRACGSSVASLLGGHRESVGVYVTFGFNQYSEDQLVEVARSLVAEGHTRLKMLIDGQASGWRRDAARVRRVREAVGDGIDLAIDANETYSLEDVSQLMRAILECNIAWIEDPVRPNDVRDLAHLRRQFGIPISAGQMDGHVSRFRHLVEGNAIDIFMPNPLFNGGITETARVAHLAQAYSRPLSDAGGGTPFSLHHVAGFRNGTLVECHLRSDSVYQQLFVDAPKPVGDAIAVPDAPGFGLTLNRDMLSETRVDPD
jgi:L-rhamnonate dehydratase